jgi:Holliday junction resolvasome RuvABC endonuclease subunit
VNTRVVGIDASLRGTGVCTLASGVFKPYFIPETKLRGAERLCSIRNRLLRIVDKFNPMIAVLEGYSYNSEGRLFEIGELGGVVKAALFDRKTRILTVAPLRLKKFIGVTRLNDKSLVIAAVKRRYKLDVGANDNLADAAVLARIGEVFLTDDSQYRAELEVVRDLKLTKEPRGTGQKWQFKKLKDAL